MSDLQLFEQNKSEFQIALSGSAIKPEQFLQTLAKLYNEKLKDCDRQSVISCALSVAENGLSPDPLRKQVYLIPFKDNNQNKTICTLLVGYRGYIDIAYRGGQEVVGYGCVHENDEFIEPEQFGMVPIHRKAIENRGDLVRAYCVTRNIKTGSVAHTVMVKEEILKRRDSSAQYRYAVKNKKENETFWFKWPDEMWIKTVMKYHLDRVPLDQKAQESLQKLNEVEYSRETDTTPSDANFQIFVSKINEANNESDDFKAMMLDSIAGDIAKANLSDDQKIQLEEMIASAR